ncbi:hypothetical protein Tanf_10850 [Tannerella forsythia]|nr:hypothetical protein Tanf_10850 [Tannerella forsythia]
MAECLQYKKKTISLHPLIIKIRSENSAEVAQLVEHHLAQKIKGSNLGKGKATSADCKCVKKIVRK